MSEILKIAVNVTTPLSLLGLLLALAYLAYTRRLKYEEKKLEKLPLNKRATQVDEYLTRYGIDGRDLSPDAKLALIKAELESRHRRSSRYVIVATVAFVICFAIAAISISINGKSKENLNAYQNASGTINRPTEGSVVNPNIDASGSAQNAGNDVYLWLAIEINGKIWPKEGRVAIDRNGNWSQRVFEDGHPVQFGLSLWATNAEGDRELQAWLINSANNHDYREIAPLSNMKRLARVQGLSLANP